MSRPCRSTEHRRPRGEANALKSLGDAALGQSRYDDVIDLYEQALMMWCSGEALRRNVSTRRDFASRPSGSRRRCQST
jgi:hypothetical protein